LEKGKQGVKPVEQLPLFVVQQNVFVVKRENDKIDELGIVKVFSQGKQDQCCKKDQSHPI
jgi:hypothetical protein